MARIVAVTAKPHKCVDAYCLGQYKLLMCNSYVEYILGYQPEKIRVTVSRASKPARGVYRMSSGLSYTPTNIAERTELITAGGTYGCMRDLIDRVVHEGEMFRVTVEDIS